MRSEIVFFDTAYQSKKGFFRGVAALGALLSLSYLWYGVVASDVYSPHIDGGIPKNRPLISTIVLSLLISSAIAVQLPKYAATAILYGALMGLVIYGCMNAGILMVHAKWSPGIALLDTMWGVCSSSAVAFLVYKIFFI